MIITIDNSTGTTELKMKLSDSDKDKTEHEIIDMVADMFSVSLVAVSANCLSGIYKEEDYINCICKNAKEMVHTNVNK